MTGSFSKRPRASLRLQSFWPSILSAASPPFATAISRSMFPRRAIPKEKGIDRPEEKDHLSLGKARHQVLGADRSTYGLDLYLWRYLSKRR
jgi:hypothetical protein